MMCVLTLVLGVPAQVRAQDAGLASIATGITEGSRTLRDVGPARAGGGPGLMAVAAPSTSVIVLPKYTNTDGQSSLAATVAVVRSFTSGAALQVSLTGAAADSESETTKSYAPSARLLSPKFGGGRLRAAATGVFAKTIDGGSRTTATAALDVTVPTASTSATLVIGGSGSLVRTDPLSGEGASQGVATGAVTLTQALLETRLEYQPRFGDVAETYAFVASSDFGKRAPLLIASVAKGSVFSLAARFTF